MIVDHSAPLHDDFCRCAVCKPSLVGETSTSLFRIRVALIGAAVVVFGLMVIR